MKWTMAWVWLASWAWAPAPLAAADPFFGHSYAVVIGIDRYPHFRQLQNAVSDARAIADYLHTQSYDQVITLYDQQATKQAIIAAMQNQLAPRLKKDDRVLIFFAGHGFTETLGGKDRGYFVPYDGDAQSAGFISMEELLSLADYMGNARHLLFIMDSCYGGLLGAETRGSLVNPNVPDYLNNVAGRITRQVLTAGGKGQEVIDGGSKGHSVFVDAILEGLADGKADRDRNGYITFNELSDYVLQRASNVYQTPLASVLPGNQGGEYLFRSPLARVAGLVSPIAPVGTARRSAEPETAATASSSIAPASVADATSLLTSAAIKRISVAVVDGHGHIIPNIYQSNFRVSEHNALRPIIDFHESGPATVAILIQVNSALQPYSNTLFSAAGSLVDSLDANDWIAPCVFDMRLKVLIDFSVDHAGVHSALAQHPASGIAQANLYDALGDLETRMKTVKSIKAIVVFTDGVDTFSKLTTSQFLAQIRTAVVPIYAIRVDSAARRSVTTQADDTLKALAAETGGQAFFPNSADDYPSVFSAIDEALHSYQISYQPTGERLPGASNVTVELVNPQTSQPLKMTDSSGGEIQYKVVVKQMP